MGSGKAEVALELKQPCPLAPSTTGIRCDTSVGTLGLNLSVKIALMGGYLEEASYIDFLDLSFLICKRILGILHCLPGLLRRLNPFKAIY